MSNKSQGKHTGSHGCSGMDRRPSDGLDNPEMIALIKSKGSSHIASQAGAATSVDLLNAPSYVTSNLSEPSLEDCFFAMLKTLFPPSPENES